ncbi:MAG: RES domain-containing protein [Methylococcales bacterium]
MAVALWSFRLVQIYRIADARHSIWNGTGAALIGGRWNSQGQPVIYGSLCYSTAMLEVLVHANIGRIPQNHRYVVAEVPDTVSVEHCGSNKLPAGWNTDNHSIAKTFGTLWLNELRSAVLIVPSVIAPLDRNALVNPHHPDFSQLIVSEARPVLWDTRLFQVTQR